ncbi:MAG: hypothetical protein M1829_005339 [Trizodia sp. TS-e1964]|nr:MAG: hypothetical protein M1829_005339 [Trizodia sp. TS-e1964]
MRIPAFSLFSLLQVTVALHMQYIDQGHHDTLPGREETKTVTHMALAGLASEIFNNDPPSDYKLFMSPQAVRDKYGPQMSVLISIGGWAQCAGFGKAVASVDSMRKFAINVHKMIDTLGADGVDINWRYPGGNCENYKTTPNSSPEKTAEIKAFPQLLTALRTEFPKNKIITVSAPGKAEDMIAWTPANTKEISNAVNWVNVMTYDLMNRRNTVTKQHSSIAESKEVIARYLNLGFPAIQLTLGFPFYARWSNTVAKCPDATGLNCPTLPLEDPTTGADTGNSGAVFFTDQNAGVKPDVLASWTRAQQDNDPALEYTYWDHTTKRFWTWPGAGGIRNKFDEIVLEYNLGGVHGKSLGQDSSDWSHIRAIESCIRSIPASNRLKTLPSYWKA